MAPAWSWRSAFFLLLRHRSCTPSKRTPTPALPGPGRDESGPPHGGDQYAPSHQRPERAIRPCCSPATSAASAPLPALPAVAEMARARRVGKPDSLGALIALRLAGRIPALSMRPDPREKQRPHLDAARSSACSSRMTGYWIGGFAVADGRRRRCPCGAGAAG